MEIIVIMIVFGILAVIFGFLAVIEEEIKYIIPFVSFLAIDIIIFIFMRTL